MTHTDKQEKKLVAFTRDLKLYDNGTAVFEGKDCRWELLENCKIKLIETNE